MVKPDAELPEDAAAASGVPCPPAPQPQEESLLARMRALKDRINPRPVPALVPAPAPHQPAPVAEALEAPPGPQVAPAPPPQQSTPPPRSVMAIGLAFEQKRKTVRNRCLRAAKAVYHDRRFQVDCQVRDESATGMKLRLGGDVAVPDKFELLIESREELIPVLVRWRRGMELGVEITGPPVPLPPRLIMDTSRRL